MWSKFLRSWYWPPQICNIRVNLQIPDSIHSGSPLHTIHCLQYWIEGPIRSGEARYYFNSKPSSTFHSSPDPIPTSSANLFTIIKYHKPADPAIIVMDRLCGARYRYYRVKPCALMCDKLHAVNLHCVTLNPNPAKMLLFQEGGGAFVAKRTSS